MDCKKFSKWFLSCSLFLLLLGTVSAAELKIAVVNFDKVFQNYYKTAAATTFINQQSAEYSNYLQKLNNDLTVLRSEYKILIDSWQNVTLEENVRENKRVEAVRKQNEIKLKEADINQYAAEKEQQMKTLMQERRDEIFKDINEEVRRRALLEGFSLVLDNSERPGGDLSSVLYANEKLDITQSILDELNRGNPVSKSSILTE